MTPRYVYDIAPFAGLLVAAGFVVGCIAIHLAAWAEELLERRRDRAAFRAGIARLKALSTGGLDRVNDARAGCSAVIDAELVAAAENLDVVLELVERAKHAAAEAPFGWLPSDQAWLLEVATIPLSLARFHLAAAAEEADRA